MRLAPQPVLAQQAPEIHAIHARAPRRLRLVAARLRHQRRQIAALEPVDRRRFRVRRRDAFARWLLSFAGDVVPRSPPEMVAEYESLVDATLARYTGAGA